VFGNRIVTLSALGSFVLLSSLKWAPLPFPALSILISTATVLVALWISRNQVLPVRVVIVIYFLAFDLSGTGSRGVPHRESKRTVGLPIADLIGFVGFLFFRTYAMEKEESRASGMRGLRLSHTNPKGVPLAVVGCSGELGFLG